MSGSKPAVSPQQALAGLRQAQSALEEVQREAADNQVVAGVRLPGSSPRDIPDAGQICVVCQNRPTTPGATLSRCARCLSVCELRLASVHALTFAYYCGRPCQLRHFPEHKKVCAATAKERADAMKKVEPWLTKSYDQQELWLARQQGPLSVALGIALADSWPGRRLTESTTGAHMVLECREDLPQASPIVATSLTLASFKQLRAHPGLGPRVVTAYPREAEARAGSLESPTVLLIELVHVGKDDRRRPASVVLSVIELMSRTPQWNNQRLLRGGLDLVELLNAESAGTQLPGLSNDHLVFGAVGRWVQKKSQLFSGAVVEGNFTTHETLQDAVLVLYLEATTHIHDHDRSFKPVRFESLPLADAATLIGYNDAAALRKAMPSVPAGVLAVPMWAKVVDAPDGFFTTFVTSTSRDRNPTRDDFIGHIAMRRRETDWWASLKRSCA